MGAQMMCTGLNFKQQNSNLNEMVLKVKGQGQTSPKI